MRQNQRHPVKHFFIVSRVQWLHIIWVLASVMAVMLFVLGSVAAIHYLKFKSGYFYFLEEGIEPEVVRHTIWEIIFPSFLASSAAASALGMVISLYSSRKIALPIYKIRRWASSLFAGDFTHRVMVRRTDHMDELAESCNQVTRRYAEIISDIKTAAEKSDLEKIKEIVGGI